MQTFLTLLKDLGIPTLSILFVIGSIIIFREVFFFLKHLRLKGAEIVIEKELQELDTRIEEFYIPLRERFRLIRLFYETTSSWQKEGIYQNEALNIKSDDPHALRNLVVQKIFLPVNNDIGEIILNKIHWKHQTDTTNYEAIVQHFLLWQVFEDAKATGEIKDYEASHILTFPAEEVNKQRDMCDWLLNERERIRQEIKEFRKTLFKKRREK